MKRYHTCRLICCLAASIIFLSMISLPLLFAGDLKIQTANVSKVGTFAGNQSIRIFRGLAPDIALLQEWSIAEGTHRGYVDQAFGPEFYYYLGYSPRNPVGDSWSQPNGIVSRWALQTWGDWEDTSGPNKPDWTWAIIDIPGEINLGVVSVHLKAGDTTEDKEQRVAEAGLIKDYIDNSPVFDTANDYIIVGGDLNAENDYEWCIDTFATFLEPRGQRPADRFGNKNTNQNRDKPYDWIMPNQLLDDLHDTLVIGTENYDYPEGIVFDSHVFSRWEEYTDAPDNTPLWNIQSILYGDSHSTVMDHMTVMKAFDVFPSPTPSPSRSPSPIPTATPLPRTPTPQPTPTVKIVIGPISGRVYDRVTGLGIANIYVRAVGEPGLGSGISNSQGYYTTQILDISTYTVLADNFNNFDYRKQYYDQKDSESQAFQVPSNSSGIDFPLYRRKEYPTPTPAPTPLFFPASIDNGDYDGNGISDIAVFRRSSGLWAIRGITSFYFGGASDMPTAADFNGDGTSDTAIFREGSGLWAIRDLTRVYFGRIGDIPLPGDYDGDGTADSLIVRRASGLWAVRNVTRLYFGGSSDLPTPFNGETAQKNIGIFRPANGLWAIRGLTRLYFGRTGDQPIPANYQGNPSSAANFGVFRESSGLWAIRDVTRVYLGKADDRPVPGNYRGERAADITIFRENNGLWAMRGFTRLYFGAAGDFPVSGLVINPSGAGSP